MKNESSSALSVNHNQSNDSRDSIIDSTDNTGAPLDLSVKSSKPSSLGNVSMDTIESLNELANLQKRFIESSAVQNYADQLQKVANGPTLPPNLLNNNNNSMNNNNCPKFVPPLWPCDWTSMYQNIPLQYQLAAYSLWSNNYASMAANQLLQQSTKPTTMSVPMSPIISPSNDPAEGSSKRLSGRNKYLDTILPAAAAPPEAFGISMRGNQKYSAYYQRPFLVPLGPASTKKLETPQRKTAQPSNPSEQEDKPERTGVTRARETAFICSCGEEFENLYIFTLHMKESDHKPKTAQSYRDIPKLVRGQDMWINSETEQTREILRCMHCHQSFRTLPDLTMHMIKTNHYSEIVYSDSGRCVFVNSDENTKKAEKRAASSASSSSISGKHPSLTDLCYKAVEKEAVLENSSSKSSKILADAPSPAKRAKFDEAVDVNGNKESSLVATMSSETKCRNEDLPPKKKALSNTTEVTEADSATPDSHTESFLADDQTTKLTSASVIRQIESFVEKNLPKAVPNTNSKICASEGSSACLNNSEKTTQDKENISKTSAPYVAPDSGNRPAENPLSSLQKLVETTHKTDAQSNLKSPGPGDSTKPGGKGSSSSTSGAHTLCPVGNLSPFMPPSPTVIMVNPTYIYQPAFPALPQMYPYPWYPSLPVYGAGMGTLDEGGTDSSTNGATSTSISASLMDLTKSKTMYEMGDATSPTGERSDDTPREITRTRSAHELSNGLPNTSNNTHTHGVIVKKAKCNYCGKPFANKGQVRLHISKGKCPSLMQTCHSTGNVSTILSSPFAYMPLDYADRAAAIQAAQSAAASTSLSTDNVTDERLKLYYSLAKQLSGADGP